MTRICVILTMVSAEFPKIHMYRNIGENIPIRMQVCTVNSATRSPPLLDVIGYARSHPAVKSLEEVKKDIQSDRRMSGDVRARVVNFEFLTFM